MKNLNNAIRRLFVVALLLSCSILSANADETINLEDEVDLQENENVSGLFVESDSCGLSFASCAEASPCFDHSMGCAEDGSIIFTECITAMPCKPCFPNSRCANDSPLTTPDSSPQVTENLSALFVESESCGPEFSSCALAANCFDHSLGCAEDGSIVFPECSTALPFCEPCFPNSRCGSDVENISGLFVESETCGPSFSSCAQAFPCFDHFMGCAEDGSITFPECSTALPACKPCFPNSRCASSDSLLADVPVDDPLNLESESAKFVASESCGFGYESCIQASPCFHHSLGCAEDGTVIYGECDSALPFCKPCFPNSRCGSNIAPHMNPTFDDELVEELTFIESSANRLGVATAIVALLASGFASH